LEKSAGLILIWDNKILLAHPTDRKEWQFPKGHVEENESFLCAAIRETLEEIGVDFFKLDIDTSKNTEPIVIEYTDRRNDVYKTVTGFVVHLNTPPTTFDFSKSVMENGKTEMDECRWFTKEEAEKVIFWRMKDALNVLNDNDPILEMLEDSNLSPVKRKEIIMDLLREVKPFGLQQWLSEKKYSYNEEKIINREEKQII
jgi:8-oxo-dGTP pyrophosphatase MutT (NUDIX family)